MKNHILSVIKLMIGTCMGYALSHHISHPNGRGRKRVPLLHVGSVQLLPNLLVATRGKHWHIHHWAYLPALYLPFFIFFRSITKKYWLHGLIAGSAIHGLTFRDRFRFSNSS